MADRVVERLCRHFGIIKDEAERKGRGKEFRVLVGKAEAGRRISERLFESFLESLDLRGVVRGWGDRPGLPGVQQGEPPRVRYVCPRSHRCGREEPGVPRKLPECAIARTRMPPVAERRQ